MGYYRKRHYRSWRSKKRSGYYNPSKYSALTGLFGDAVIEIQRAFMSLDKDALDELFLDYAELYGISAATYARKTFPNWKSGATKLSGQTMERLVELVPPYLSPERRFSILQIVLRRHKKSAPHRHININVKQPEAGFAELQSVLSSMSHDDILAHLPASVMKAASWLYDDDITAARSMLADAERLENDMTRSKAAREIELLRKTIATGQVQTAHYSVEMPAGTISVSANTPSKCFVATVCFGETAPETVALREWRDGYLANKNWGVKFINWYYSNGESIANFVAKSRALKTIAKGFIGIFAKAIAYESIRRAQ